MDGRDKREFLSIRMKGKLGKGDATADEVKFLRECRKEFPEICKELDEEVQHRAMEAMNPFYERPSV